MKTVFIIGNSADTDDIQDHAEFHIGARVLVKNTLQGLSVYIKTLYSSDGRKHELTAHISKLQRNFHCC